MTKPAAALHGTRRLVSALNEKYVEENVEKDIYCPLDML